MALLRAYIQELIYTSDFSQHIPVNDWEQERLLYKTNCNTMGGTWSRKRIYPHDCSPDEVSRTAAGEYQMTDMNNLFLPVADAVGQRQDHHSDFEHQGHLRVAWEKHDNLEVEMEKKEKRNCINIDSK